MKFALLIAPALIAATFFSGCISAGSTGSSSSSSSDSGGIDPVTMAGIEASNRATDEAAQQSANAAAAAAATANQ